LANQFVVVDKHYRRGHGVTLVPVGG
jgi:hypothetical protein